MPTNLSSGMIPYSSLPEMERPIASQQKIQAGSDMTDIASVDPDKPGIVTVDRPSSFTPQVAAHELIHAIQNRAGSLGDGSKNYSAQTGDISKMNVEQQAQVPLNYMNQYPQAVAKGGKAVDALNAAYARPVQQLRIMAANGMPLTPQPPGAPPAALTGIAVPLPGMMSTSTMSQAVPLTPFQHLAIAAKNVTSMVSNPNAKPGPYTTQLPPQQEAAFQNWVKQNKVPFDPSPKSDYDMRGYYKALTTGDPAAKQQLSGFDGRMHFPDTYKTPYHKTFSNESRYAKPSAPHWEGNLLVDSTGKVVADETPKKK